jgi:shikimate dehydrogenase
MRSADGLVNATPIGMARYAGVPLSAALLQPAMWVVDIIYFPKETELLRQARALGCRAMNGGGMAVFQAAEAFRLFSGRTADPKFMQDVFTALCATAPDKLMRRNGWPEPERALS